MVYQIILVWIILTCAGFAKAVADASSDSKIKFRPESYWIKEKSWVRKWKNGDPTQGERFWLSSRQLVALTDAWHLFGLIERISFAGAYLLIGLLTADSSWFFLFAGVGYAWFALIFHISYTYTLVKR